MVSFILALFALSFLIFIHELGHYFMARRVKMRVETFSIGFGRPIFSWMMDGTRWQIGWLLFGGYVKIAGTDEDKNRDPYAVKDGFFGKSPWQRMAVAFMGPLVNLLFALMVFALVWVNGGREKPFSEYTHKIGYLDPASDLFKQGIRAGDEIYAYDSAPYVSGKDHFFYPLISSGHIQVSGVKEDYSRKEKTPFDMEVEVKSSSLMVNSSIPTAGVVAPARYVIYAPRTEGADEKEGLSSRPAILQSGIMPKDRLVWVDGHLLFSLAQLSSLINDDRLLVTVLREGKPLLRRVPRVQVRELRLDALTKEEIVDWQYEAKLQAIRTEQLFVFPYNLSNEGVVENRFRFIEKEDEEKVFPTLVDSPVEEALLPQDKIVAIAGQPVDRAFQIMEAIRLKKVVIIVDRTPLMKDILWRDADRYFDDNLGASDIEAIAKTIGTKEAISQKGTKFRLLPIVPVSIQDIALDTGKKAILDKELESAKEEAESIEDPEKRARALELIQTRFKQKVLGLSDIVDLDIIYNPVPTSTYGSVFQEIRRTLGALFSGHLSPKWLSGPIGIVSVVQHQGMSSINDALFWLGAISLNLGILNLLPIPMLDGGTILFSLFEGVTGIKIKPKTMEKVILPFAVLLILFFLFVTYHDLLRLLSW